MTLPALIEALLFWRAEPIELAQLAKLTNKSEAEIAAAIEELDRQLAERGVQLMRKDKAVMLGAHPAAGETINRLAKEELSRDLGRAGLETLTIILYRGPIARAEIDYLRGVNSTFILRHLMVRGLVERIPNPEDGRAFLYRTTFDLLQHLGIKRVEDLPDYATLKS